MRAVVLTDFGTEPLVTELPVPQPSPGEVLVRLHAAGVNPFDWKVGDGAMRGVVEHGFPLVMGSDGAGTVESVGDGVEGFTAGDRVFGQFMRLQDGQGSYAEYAVVDPGKLAPLPSGLSFVDAAALPTAGATGKQTVDALGLRPGEVVLINGGSGGVGQFAVQFAARTGATVVTTGTPEAAEHLRSLGATQVLSFSSGPTVQEQFRDAHPDGAHAVLDLVTGASAAPTTNPLADLLRPGGVLLSTNGAAFPDDLAARGLRGIDFYNRFDRNTLQSLGELVASGELTLVVQARIRLDEVPDAVAAARSGHASGKTVIELVGS